MISKKFNQNYCKANQPVIYKQLLRQYGLQKHEKCNVISQNLNHKDFKANQSVNL